MDDMTPESGGAEPGMMNGGMAPAPMSNGPTGGTLASNASGMTANVGNKVMR